MYLPVELKAFISHINLPRNIKDLKTNLPDNNQFFEFVRLYPLFNNYLQ